MWESPWSNTQGLEKVEYLSETILEDFRGNTRCYPHLPASTYAPRKRTTPVISPSKIYQDQACTRARKEQSTTRRVPTVPSLIFLFRLQQPEGGQWPGGPFLLDYGQYGTMKHPLSSVSQETHRLK